MFCHLLISLITDTYIDLNYAGPVPKFVSWSIMEHSSQGSYYCYYSIYIITFYCFCQLLIYWYFISTTKIWLMHICVCVPISFFSHYVLHDYTVMYTRKCTYVSWYLGNVWLNDHFKSQRITLNSRCVILNPKNVHSEQRVCVMVNPVDVCGGWRAVVVTARSIVAHPGNLFIQLIS